MAVTDAYADATAYKALFKKTDAADDSVITDDLAAVSRYIDHKLGRHFTVDAAAVARTFYPYQTGGSVPGLGFNPEAENPWKGLPRSRWLYVDDIAVAPTFVKIDEDRNGSFEKTLATTDYQLLPLNANKGAEPRPWNALFLPTYSTLLGWQPGALVEITAQWGWASVPKAIKQACIHLTGILRLESPRATNRVPDGIDSAVSTSKVGQEIISGLLKHYAKVDL